MAVGYLFIFLILISNTCFGKKSGVKPDWAKKDITDYTDADMERLLDQWEEDEEPLEPDELPEHLRPRSQIDLSKLQGSNAEDVIKESKKGKTLMVFVAVNGNPTKEETETITKLWQSSLWNNHIQAERYIVDDDRVIFLFKEGSQAWDAKEFLIEQERCKEVSIDSKIYPGKFTTESQNDSSTKEEL